MRRSALAFAALVSVTCYGYEDQRSKENLAEDYADCSVYFSITAANAKASGMDDQYVSYNQASKQSLDAAGMLMAAHKPGYLVEMTRLKIGVQNHVFESSGWYGLFNQYGKFCKELMQDPRPRMQYWLEKK